MSYKNNYKFLNSRALNLKVLALSALLTACAGSPVVATTFDEAMKQAVSEIDKAKSMDYEWRDSRKMLDKAVKLEKEGKHDEAMKLIAAATEQGKLAVAQARQQMNVNGPH